MAKFNVNYPIIKDVLEKGVQIRTLSSWGQFALQCIGYRFTDDKGKEIFKYQLWEKGYTDIDKLLSGEYPIGVYERPKKERI